MFSPVLKKGSAELLILSLLEDEPLHGYEIAKRIERRSNGLLEFRVSSLYPILCRLDERGWVYIAEESGHVAAYAPVPHLSLVR